MRLTSAVLSALVFSTAAAVAQTGFSTASYVLPAGHNNARLLTADFNNDGRPDLLSYGLSQGSQANYYPGGLVFLNNGSGGFLAPIALPGPSVEVTAAQAADLNQDGSQDIVACVTSSTGDSLVVYLNNGSGSFTIGSSQPVPGSCNALTVGDVNRDGHLDVVTAGYSISSGVYNNHVITWLSDGTGKLSAQTSQTNPFDDPSNNYPVFTNCGLIDIVGTDFLQNGQFSLVLTTQCNAPSTNLHAFPGTTYFGSGNSSASNGNYFTFSKVSSDYALFRQGYVFKRNSSDRPNVVFVVAQNYSFGDLILLKNNGNGSFEIQGLLVSGSFGGSAAGDFNNDGYNDIAASYDAGGGNAIAPVISILLGTTNGAFTNSQTFPTGPSSYTSNFYPEDVTVGDFNGDGLSDIATLVYQQGAARTSLMVYTNTQTGGNSSCPIPTQNNTNIICSPANRSSATSPVAVSAASNVANFTLNRLYLDNKAVYQTTSQGVSTSLTVSAGKHSLVLVSYNNTGQAFTATSNFTVGMNLAVARSPRK